MTNQNDQSRGRQQGGQTGGGRDRGEAFDEQQGGGRGRLDVDQQQRDQSEFERDQQAHQDRGQGDIEPERDRSS
jgi:hypothetical protein